MGYRYETHMHTCQASACGRSTGAEHADFYKKAGYTGIIITDHFFGGNCAIDRHLPWRERIERFCAGYYDAKAEGDRIGLDVFFGWEETFQGDDYLVYGLSPEWLLNHPEAEHFTRRQQLETVHRDGGCVVQAHPFRNRDYIWRILLGKDFADAAEVANAGNEAGWDAYAIRYAREYGLYMTAGSDNHFSGNGKPVYGVESEVRWNSIQDYVDCILQRKPLHLLVPPERFDRTDDMQPLTSYWLTPQEDSVPTGRDWLWEA